MRILGGASPHAKHSNADSDEFTPSSPTTTNAPATPSLRRQSFTQCTRNDSSTLCYNVWRSRNTDDDDENIAIGKSSSSPSSTEPWMTALLVVAFDHDKGPVFEHIAPSNRHPLTTAELDSILYHSMPDSACMHSTHEHAYYTFRIPRRVNDTEHASVIVASTRLLLAHVLFTQTPNASTPRGYSQKSLVFVTSTPYIALPALVLSTLCASMLSSDRDVATLIHNVVHDVRNWPDPRTLRACDHGSGSGSESEQVVIGERNDKKKIMKMNNTYNTQHLLLPLGDELISIEWTDAFLSSFAAPRVHLYSPNEHVANTFSSSPPSVLSNHDDDTVPPTTLFTHYSPAHHWHPPFERFHSSPMSTTPPCAHHDDASPPSKRRADKPAVVTAWPLTHATSHGGAVLFNEVNPVSALTPVLDVLPCVWEVIALGEPLLIVAKTPTQCSAAVMAVLSLVHPLPIVGEWRPYLCIHDVEYARIVDAKDVRDLYPDGAIVGVSNMHMAETMHFPHVLYMDAGDGSGSGRFKSKWKTCLNKSKSIKQVVVRIQRLTAAIDGSLNMDSMKWTKIEGAHHRNEMEDDVVFQLVSKFRRCVYDKYTRPFLSIFDRYLSPIYDNATTSSTNSNNNNNNSSRIVPSVNHHHQHYQYKKKQYNHNKNNDHEVDMYELDPFDKKLRLLNFQRDAFPTPDDLLVIPCTLFRLGKRNRQAMRATYQRFIQSGVFMTWFHAHLTNSMQRCHTLHAKFVANACNKGCAVIIHDIMKREYDKLNKLTSVHTNNVLQLNVTEHVAQLTTRVHREKERAVSNDSKKLEQVLQRELDYLITELPRHKQKLFLDVE